MSSTISFPTIEGGSHAHGFLARALAVTGVPVPPSGDPFFPSRETRTLQPFPANVVGAEHADHFQDSVRDLLIQAGDDWKFLSLFGVHNSHVSGSVQPTLLIVLQPNSATVDRAMAMVGEVFAIQQRLGINPLFAIEVVEGSLARYNSRNKSIEEDYFPEQPYPDQVEPIQPPAKILVQSPASEVRDAKIAALAARKVPDNTHSGPLTLTTKLKTDEQAVARVRGYDCRFGTVVLTSGVNRILSSRHAIDFALISLDLARFPEGFKPSFNDPCGSALEFLADCGHDSSKAQKENKVFKTGATSGTTYGNLSHKKAHLRDMPTGVGGVSVPFNSQESIVLDTSPDNRFATFGDSGAVIRDGGARMVGMLWGGLKGEKAHPIYLDQCAVDLSVVTMYTPMEILLEAMQAEICRVFPGVSVTLTIAPMSCG